MKKPPTGTNPGKGLFRSDEYSIADWTKKSNIFQENTSMEHIRIYIRTVRP